MKLKAPTVLDSQYGKYIANVEYDNYGDLSHIVLAKGGIIKLNPQVKNESGIATTYYQKFELVDERDRNFISINDEGYINTRQVKETDEGKIKVRATLKALKSKANNNILNGDVEIVEKVIEFDVSVFVQITSISLNKQYANVYFSNNLWYENNVKVNLNETSLNLSIYPQNANPDSIVWEVNDNSAVNIEPSDDNKILYITANDGNVQKTVSITVFVTQKNKTYSKTCYLSINPVITPKSIQIDGVEYHGFNDTELNKRVVLNENNYQINGITQSVKEIYIDSRDLSSESYIDIFSHIGNNDSTNKTIYYELYRDNYQICSLTPDGKLTFNTSADALIAGTAIIRVFAQGSKTDKAADPKISEYIAVKVSNGENENNAFLVRSEKDFWKMLRDAQIENHYYVLSNNIYLTKSLSQADSEGQLKYNGKAPLYFASQSGARYAIKNLVIDKVQTTKNSDNENVADILSLFIEAYGHIKNIDFSVSINDSNAGYLSKNIIVAPIAAYNNGIIENVCVSFENLNLSNLNNQSQIENFIFGGVVGYNGGRIKSTNKNFVESSRTYYVNFTGNIILNDLDSSIFADEKNTAIGAVAGINNGEIVGMIVENSVVKTNLSNVGGLVGLNYNLIENNLINCDVIGNENIGGLVGLNVSADVHNNIVEIYETNRINEILKTQTTYSAISGNKNIGGLIGFVNDVENYYESEIMYNYIRCYNSRILIAGAENVGGFIGCVNILPAEVDEEIIKTIIDTNFAYTFLASGINVGGFVGQITNATVSNVYARGQIDGQDIASLFGNDILEADVDLSDAYYVESTKHSDFITAPWTVSMNYNDGYSVLTFVNDDETIYLMEKVIPNEIVVSENQKVIKVSQNNFEVEIDEWFSNVKLSDLILTSSDSLIFTIGQSNKIVFRGYGKAVLNAYSKYNRSITNQIEVVFIYDIDDLKLCDADDIYSTNYLDYSNSLEILKNSSTTLYPFAIKDGNQLENLDNLYISFKYYGNDECFYINNQPIVAEINQVIVFDEDSQEEYLAEERIFTKFAYGELILTALEKSDISVAVVLYQKIGNEYFELLDDISANKYIEISIKEGIKSISIDKSEVDLTTMNEVEFTVSIVADIGNLKFDFEDSEGHIDNIAGANKDKELILVDNNEEPIQNDDDTYTYIRTFTLRVKDEYFKLENTTDNLLREAFSTILNIKVSNDEQQLDECSLRVNVKPQELLKIDTLHFPSGLQTTLLSGETVFEANELPANTLTPGEFGLLMIDI